MSIQKIYNVVSVAVIVALVVFAESLSHRLNQMESAAIAGWRTADVIARAK